MAEYVDVAAGRSADGLRLVLTEGVPGPWSEAAKAILHVKRLPYIRVRQVGGGDNRELLEWTGQSGAPVAVWNDEPPRTTSREILHLAERLAPEPALLPAESGARALVLGISEEIHGERGFGWCRRLMMLDAMLRLAPRDAKGMKAVDRMAGRYGYDVDPDGVTQAAQRAAGILRMLADRLEAQRATGSSFLVGDRLTAADLYWATFAALLEPLPHDLCPMPDGLRGMYTSKDAIVAAALRPSLIEHRDFIYREFLELPMDF